MGGNVFKHQTSNIPKENIQYTLEQYSNELQKIFPNKQHLFQSFTTLGSVGKKDFSGDIDLAFNSKTFLPDFWDKSLIPWGLNPIKVKDTFVKFQKRAKTSTSRQIMVRAFLQELAIYINEHSELIYCDIKKVNSGNIFTLFPQFSKDGMLETSVQIDWMVGDLDWLMFSYYSDVYEGNVKGLHRTQLMLSMFTNKDYMFNHISGIKDKETGDTLAYNPSEAIELLNKAYGCNLDNAILSNYFLLIEYIKNNLPDDYINIIDIYFKVLDSTRCDIPLDLQPLWKQRKNDLNLSGKFLPDDSNLKGL